MKKSQTYWEDLATHRKDKDHQGSIVLNIYEKGSLHVDHVDNQNFYGDKCLRPTQQEDKTPPTLPPPLSSPEAMAIWQKVREAGYVDENYQPLISRTQSALLANAMATRLGIRKKWKVFETLWHRTKTRQIEAAIRLNISPHISPMYGGTLSFLFRIFAACFS